MKVICDRAALLDALNMVASVVPTRTPMPALSCVKLTATKGDKGGGGELTLAGTDNETSLQLSVTHVDVQQAGSGAIPADKLRQIVQAEDGEPTLTLEIDGDQCHIRGANAHFRVFCFPAADFPPLPDFGAAISGSGPDAARTVFAQPAGQLADIIARTVFATARETSRYAINGVLLKRDGKKLEMVATDGRRLALCRATIPGSMGGASSGGSKGDAVTCIIPTKALMTAQKLVRDGEESVRMAIGESRVFFAFGGGGGSEPEEGKKSKSGGGGGGAGHPRAILSSTLVEGTFPPYEDVIPRENDKKITAGREELTSAVRKATVLTNEESRGVRMSFTGGDKRLKLSSRAPEMGESEIAIDLAGYEGTDIEISFNPTFLVDVLKVVNDPQVIVELKAPNKPGLIRSESGDFVYVVMPVNLPT